MPPANRLGRPCALPRARLGRCMGRIALVRSAQVDRRRGYPAVRLAARRHPQYGFLLRRSQYRETQARPSELFWRRGSTRLLSAIFQQQQGNQCRLSVAKTDKT